MKDGQLFRVKIIKSEKDLPEWGISVPVKLKNGEFYSSMGYNEHQKKHWWLNIVEWYLIPEPEIDEKSDVSDSDIEAWARKN